MSRVYLQLPDTLLPNQSEWGSIGEGPIDLYSTVLNSTSQPESGFTALSERRRSKSIRVSTEGVSFNRGLSKAKSATTKKVAWLYKYNRILYKSAKTLELYTMLYYIFRF